MLIPYGTDAPVYYWPLATVGLIVANVVAFVGVMNGTLPVIDDWLLWYGDGLHPVQWLLSMFMHGGIVHLVGNMVFLWVFGLVVEGKLGWWKFLACYLAIGVTQSMFEQIVMLNYQGDVAGSLGASAAIFGVMGMAVVWAPLNDIHCLWALRLYLAGSVDVPIIGFAALYAGMETLFLLLPGDSGSSWLHLSGMAIGIPMALILLQAKLVDCEGWDLLHYIRGEHGSDQKKPRQTEHAAAIEARQQHRDEQQLHEAQKQFAFYLQNGNAVAALLLYEKMREVGGGLSLAYSEFLTLINALHTAKRWKDSAPLMAECIERFPDRADPIRVKLAQICVVELERPGKALELLTDVDSSKLPEKHAVLAQRVAAKARQMQNEGVVEFDDDTW